MNGYILALFIGVRRTREVLSILDLPECSVEGQVEMEVCRNRKIIISSVQRLVQHLDEGSPRIRVTFAIIVDNRQRNRKNSMSPVKGGYHIDMKMTREPAQSIRIRFDDHLEA